MQLRHAEQLWQYSVIEFIKTFSSSGASVQGPLHPHLHSNGALTHPIILLFNALVTNKRIIFLGHNNPAGKVSNYVLSACALGSGCGAILRGYIERAFPYANLINREEWESMCVVHAIQRSVNASTTHISNVSFQPRIHRRCDQSHLRVF